MVDMGLLLERLGILHAQKKPQLNKGRQTGGGEQGWSYHIEAP